MNSGLYRMLEIVPGALSWATLAGVVIASWLAPAVAGMFIIVFDVYWFLKTVYLSLHLRSSFKKMRMNMKIDWIGKLEGLGVPSWREVYHVVLFPMYREPYEILRESIEGLLKTNYPKDRLLVVIGREARVPESEEIAVRLEREFGSKFGAFLVTAHPEGIPGEIPGKGSNETWACRRAQEKIIDARGLPYENILVSVFDADTRVAPEYFGILTFAFLAAPHPQRSSYQPIPFFTNNIFQAPALGRVIAFSSTFWHLMQQSRPERLTTFSSHAMPFQALVEIGFWHTNIVSEDSRIFWQCFFHYHGDWRTVPILYPISMDANVAPSLWKTLANLYRQQRRWGWGCENIPYILYSFLRTQKIPRYKKLYWSFHYMEGFHAWATNALIIFSLGWLPVILGGSEFNVTIFSYNLPRITRAIMSASMIGIVSSAILGMILLPPKPAWFRRRHYVLYVAQWLLMPLTLIIFGAFPGLEAQTRLMLGGRWRLGFWFTPKYRER